MVIARIAVLLAGLACLAAAPGFSQTGGAPPPPAAGPAWKQVYEDSQTVYYVDAANVPRIGQAEVQTLMAFKAPEVFDGVQVWSILSRMKLSCDQREMMTLDNTFHALPMGGGRVVQSQPSSDNWHSPKPGSLGELVWNSACGK